MNCTRISMNQPIYHTRLQAAKASKQTIKAPLKNNMFQEAGQNSALKQIAKKNKTVAVAMAAIAALGVIGFGIKKAIDNKNQKQS